MKLKESYATDAYILDGGYYVIKQPNPMHEDDSIILLTPDQMRLIMEHMEQALKDDSWFSIQE